VIRRGFWLMTGAVTGNYGYRRVSAVGRRVAATLSPGRSAALGPGRSAALSAGRSAALSPGGSAALGPRGRASRGPLTAGRLAREAFRFARDVREGMALYSARHDAPAGSTLTTDHEAQPEDGR
jgi:hypothetical protein